MAYIGILICMCTDSLHHDTFCILLYCIVFSCSVSCNTSENALYFKQNVHEIVRIFKYLYLRLKDHLYIT